MLNFKHLIKIELFLRICIVVLQINFILMCS